MNRSKNTKRFSFHISTNDKSHQAGANTVSIAVKDYVAPSTKGYAVPVGDVSPGQKMTMTVKEAKAFQKFLNTYFTSPTI